MKSRWTAGAPAGRHARREFSRPSSWHALIDEILMARVRIIHDESGESYEAPAHPARVAGRGAAGQHEARRAPYARRRAGRSPAEGGSRRDDELEPRRSDRAVPGDGARSRLAPLRGLGDRRHHGGRPAAPRAAHGARGAAPRTAGGIPPWATSAPRRTKRSCSRQRRS